MSVLFKALQRAEKARNDGAPGEAAGAPGVAAPGPGPDAGPEPLSAPRAGRAGVSSSDPSAPPGGGGWRQRLRGMPAVGRASRPQAGAPLGRRVVRLLGAGLVAMLGLLLGFLYLNAEDVEAMLAEALMGDSHGRPPGLTAGSRPPRKTPDQVAASAPAVPPAALPPGALAPGAPGGAPSGTPAAGPPAPESPAGASSPPSSPNPGAAQSSHPPASAEAAAPGQGSESGASPSGTAAPSGRTNLADLMAEARAARADRAAGGSGTAPPGDGPLPRATLDETLAAQGRRGVADAVRPPVDVRRGEAQMAGAPGTVGVSVARQDPQDMLGSGYRALLRGDYHMALNTYDALLREQPRSVAAHLGRAAALHKMGRVEEARTAYERVLGFEPGNREALTNLLSIVAMAAPTQALAELQSLERSAPDFSPVPAQIALVQARLGRTPEAITALRRAVALEPGNLLYRYNLAVLEDRAGLGRDAARSYQAVLDGLAAQGASEQGAQALAQQADDIRARMRYLMSGAP